MKKSILVLMALALSSLSVHAGGILTNTNTSGFFHRMIARGASTDIDAVLSNPAGLTWNLKDGFHLAASYQYVFQKRDIDASYKTYPNDQIDKFYKGRTNAPYVPSFYAIWKNDDWAVSGMMIVSGGGGKAVFEDGIPTFEAAAQAGIYKQSQGHITHDMVDLNTYMEGSQYIFGFQVGATHRFSDHFSAYAGLRASLYSGGVKGHLTADLKDSYAAMGQAMGLKDKRLAYMAVDCEQNAIGLNPVLGVDLKFGNLLIAAKYEFMTKFSLKNKTKENTDPEGALAPYRDGVKSRNDMPAMAALFVGYDFTSWLRAQAGVHYYFDKDCTMSGGRQKLLAHNSSEILFGIEADLSKRFLISTGVQFTDFGITDNYQSDSAFYLDSYTLGLGGAYRLTKNLRATGGVFLTLYHDYKHLSENFAGTGLPGTLDYQRISKSFAVTLDYSF